MPFYKCIKIIQINQGMKPYVLYNGNDSELKQIENKMQEMKTKEIDEELDMQLKWNQWMPAGTEAMYHLLRCVAQCPLREYE
jgi:hypothetical protein